MSEIQSIQDARRRKTSNKTVHLKKRTVLAGFFILMFLMSSCLSIDLAYAAYNVTINTVYNGLNNGTSVSIIMDGVATGFKTPHTFSGLLGIHNFTVPYEDASGHPFRRWDTSTPGDQTLTTITVSGAGSFWAFYDAQLPRGNGGATGSVSAAEQRYFVTPSDPAVLAAASGKSWSDIINWVASQITYNYSCGIWQFPNETLALGSGQCREFSTLAVSMLLARGYTAYIVSGQVTATSGVNISDSSGHVWIVVQLNGSLYHFEPQKTWANQPKHQNFSGYLPEHFNDNLVLLPALSSLDPPLAETYDVTIHSNYNDVFDAIPVAITKDGVATGFSTPHTFAGLTGVHNFTVPYSDDQAHPFMCWGTNYPGERIFATISVTSGGSFSAFFDTEIDLSSLYPAEHKYLVTPQDPAVLAAASGRNVSSIVDFVAAIPYAYNTAPQYPNQTLVSGSRYVLDYASLCVSMLRSRGYTAYLVGGNASGATGGRWVVFGYSGVLYHINPSYSWTQQQTLDFSSYRPSYYVDERGIYPPIASMDPPYTLPSPNESPSPTLTFTSAPTQTPLPTPGTTMTYPSPSPTLKATDSPSATSSTSYPTTSNQSGSTLPPPSTSSPTTPLPSVPEMHVWAAVSTAFFVTVGLTALKRNRRKRGASLHRNL